MSQAISQAAPSAFLQLPASGRTQRAADGFTAQLNSALERVSAAQDKANIAGRDAVTGAPGASLEQAVVMAAHAQVDWNAAVAVRNGVVNAYNTIMNMPV